MSSAVRRFPLSGADLVLVGMSEVANAPANNALIVVECAHVIAPERLRGALERFLDACPWPAARLERSFPWGALHWVAAPRPGLVAPTVHHRRAPRAAMKALIESELGTPIDPTRESPVRFLIVEHDGEATTTRASLIMTWFHALMDPRGAQNLLLHLATIDEHDGRLPWGDTPPAFVPAAAPRPFFERARIASKCWAFLKRFSSEPPLSPGTGVASPGPLRFRHEQFVDTDFASDSLRNRQDFWFRLAVVGSAVSAIAQERGWPDRPLIVPISLDQRRKGDPEPTFSNTLGFHFARFKPSEAQDIDALAHVLRMQVTDAVREGAIEAVTIGLEYQKYRRPAKIALGMPWAASGDLFSFACADIGALPPTLHSLFGARVLNAYHAATIPPRPGLGVFFNHAGGTNNLVVCWSEGVVDERHVAHIIAVVQSCMAWARLESTTS